MKKLARFTISMGLLFLLVIAVKHWGPAQDSTELISLAEARRGFATHLTRFERKGVAAPVPPPRFFHLVHYKSATGQLPAYLSTTASNRGKHPAIIWIVGGFDNSIDETAWSPGPPENDQSASAFRDMGIAMMFPCLRGGNDDLGYKEGFYGEVDDVLAAVEYLSKVPNVDPARIYLGGHSTGGTLALLAAESTDRFRAVFSFGPVEDVTGYGADVLPFNVQDRKERDLRAPGRFMQSIHAPTFVFEGTSGRSNINDLRMMMDLPHSPAVHFYPIRGADHFGTLQPTTRLIARRILADTGTQVNIQFSEEELALSSK